VSALPRLMEPYPLAEEDVSAFRVNGHVLLRGALRDDEVEAFRPVIAEGVDRFKRERRPLEERDAYGKAFLQVANLWQSDDRVAVFVLAPRFARIAAELMGVPAVRIYHDQALFKEPGGDRRPGIRTRSTGRSIPSTR
jgi:hypothetical protein